MKYAYRIEKIQLTKTKDAQSRLSELGNDGWRALYFAQIGANTLAVIFEKEIDAPDRPLPQKKASAQKKEIGDKENPE